MQTDPLAPSLPDQIVELGKSHTETRSPRLESHPRLAALRRAGTRHVFGDSADDREIGELIDAGSDAVWDEIDGNTANQPLIRKVIERYLEANDVADWATRLKATGATRDEIVRAIYAILCCRAAGDVVAPYAAGREWQVSLQLHIDLVDDAAAAKETGRLLRRTVPTGVVKVPFAPHQPHCFLVARDLQREGIPINFTSTFSARQTVAAALFADVTLTNIFMGRLNQGLRAALLGEHVDLCAQRELRALRDRGLARTLLIVASVREWETFVRVAGCDVFTSPCGAIAEFMNRDDIEDVHSQLETSYEDRLGIAEAVTDKLDSSAIARLYRVEPELVEFLAEFRKSRDYENLRGGDELYRQFDTAGFGDLFYAPSATEWEEMRRNKLPDLDSELIGKMPLDTLFTLLADADFAKYQEEMDAMIVQAAKGSLE